ncbi:MAG: hypothetical protein ABL951_10210, partial [Alphaproteobacteria bacterium]
PGAKSAGDVLIIPIYAAQDATDAPVNELWRPEAAKAAEMAPAEAIAEKIILPAEEPVQAVQQVVVAAQPEALVEPAPDQEPELPEAPAGPKRGGWWQRQFGKA